MLPCGIDGGAPGSPARLRTRRCLPFRLSCLHTGEPTTNPMRELDTEGDPVRMVLLPCRATKDHGRVSMPAIVPAGSRSRRSLAECSLSKARLSKRMPAFDRAVDVRQHSLQVDALLKPLRTLLGPLLGLDAEKHALHPQHELDADRGPVLFLQLLPEAAEDHGGAFTNPSAAGCRGSADPAAWPSRPGPA